jgi:hypothetical protein
LYTFLHYYGVTPPSAEVLLGMNSHEPRSDSRGIAYHFLRSWTLTMEATYFSEIRLNFNGPHSVMSQSLIIIISITVTGLTVALSLLHRHVHSIFSMPVQCECISRPASCRVTTEANQLWDLPRLTSARYKPPVQETELCTQPREYTRRVYGVICVAEK